MENAWFICRGTRRNMDYVPWMSTPLPRRGKVPQYSGVYVKPSKTAGEPTARGDECRLRCLRKHRWRTFLATVNVARAQGGRYTVVPTVPRFNGVGEFAVGRRRANNKRNIPMENSFRGKRAELHRSNLSNYKSNRRSMQHPRYGWDRI